MHIKEYIESKEMTVAEAARDFGCTDQAMRYWVKGSRIPRHEQMLRIVEWSGGTISPGDFYD